ncbi:hypothetical protein [Williamsoniiplasma luminosum]|nr:hypothetical protein [Williamsoniiplasma luminosum]
MTIKIGEIYEGWTEQPGDYYETNGEYKFTRPLIIEKIYSKDRLVRIGIASTKLKPKYIFKISIPAKNIIFEFDKYETMIISEKNLRAKIIDLWDYPKIYKQAEGLKQLHERALKLEKTKLDFEQSVINGQYALLSPEKQEYERTMNQFSPKEQAHRKKCEQERIKLIEQLKQTKILNNDKTNLK